MSEEAILTYFQDVSVPVIRDRQVEENRDPKETLGGLIKAFGEAAVSKSEVISYCVWFRLNVSHILVVVIVVHAGLNRG